MENFLIENWTLLKQYIDPIYLSVFILLSFTIKNAFSEALNKATKKKWKAVYTVLIMATVLAVPFVLYTDSTWINILVTYAVGTSMYELILAKIYSFLSKK